VCAEQRRTSCMIIQLELKERQSRRRAARVICISMHMHSVGYANSCEGELQGDYTISKHFLLLLFAYL
jgi:hypothetical protein